MGPECVFCGCEDTYVAAAPGTGGWFQQHGVAVCNHCQNRFNFKPLTEEEEAAQQAAEPEVIYARRPGGGPVRYEPVRCPCCRSRNVPVHTTRPSEMLPIIVRYHKCKQCGHPFKSVEEKEPEDES